MIFFHILISLLPAPLVALATWLVTRALGPALRSRSLMIATLACGVVVPIALAGWSATFLVPEWLHPPEGATDGFPPGPLLAVFSLGAVPVALLTSYVIQRRMRAA